MIYVPSLAVMKAVSTGHNGRDMYRDVEHQPRGYNVPEPDLISWRSVLAQVQIECYTGDQETMRWSKVEFNAYSLVS